jgi:hypothetical protein
VVSAVEMSQVVRTTISQMLLPLPTRETTQAHLHLVHSINQVHLLLNLLLKGPALSIVWREHDTALAAAWGARAHLGAAQEGGVGCVTKL